MSSRPARLFVYGTLMRGERLAPVLAELRPSDIQPATTDGVLLDLGDYPGLVVGDGGAMVVGELVTLPDGEAAFAVLDEVEGFFGDDSPDNLYQRMTVSVVTWDGLESTAWTYVYVADAGSAIRIDSSVPAATPLPWRLRTTPSPALCHRPDTRRRQRCTPRTQAPRAHELGRPPNEGLGHRRRTVPLLWR